MKALALLLLVGCAGTMHRAAQVTEVLAYGSLACDEGSTDTMARAGWGEANPVMGTHPSRAVIVAYFAGVSSAVFGLNRVSPDWVRVAGNLAMTAIEIRADRGNYAYGVPTCGVGNR